MDLRRRRPIGVELLKGRLQNVALPVVTLRRRPRPRVERLSQLRDELDPLDHPASAHLEDLDDGACRTELQAEGIAIAELDPGHLLLTGPLRLDRLDRVAQLRRLLEALRGRRLRHPIAKPGDELVAPAFEKELRVLHRHPVFLLGAQLPHARRDAPLDVVLEAGPAALAGNRLVAGSDPEQSVRQRHRPPAERRRQVGPRIEVIVALDAARDQHPRERLTRRELEVRVVLVVPEEDVVLRSALLDQVILERERFHDRVGDDDLEALRFVEQGVDARAHALRAQVAPDAIAEDPRLADVQRFARLVVIEVDARLLRKTRYLGLEITNRHALHCEFWRSPEPFIIARRTRQS